MATFGSQSKCSFAVLCYGRKGDTWFVRLQLFASYLVSILASFTQSENPAFFLLSLPLASARSSCLVLSRSILGILLVSHPGHLMNLCPRIHVGNMVVCEGYEANVVEMKVTRISPIPEDV
jgi:hypothetical protein